MGGGDRGPLSEASSEVWGVLTSALPRPLKQPGGQGSGLQPECSERVLPGAPGVRHAGESGSHAQCSRSRLQQGSQDRDGAGLGAMDAWREPQDTATQMMGVCACFGWERRP